MQSKLRLRLQPSKVGSGSGFVKMSASWSLEEMNLICSSFCVTRSLTKWKSTLMCLVRAWKTGLEDRYVAPMLSHQRTGGQFWETPNSLYKDCTHIILAVAFATALYSASVLLRDSTTTKHCSLFMSTPGDQIWSEEYSMSPRGSPIIWTTSPVSIGEGGQNTLQEMCWLVTLKICHWIVIMVDLWWFYDEKIIIKNGASLMTERDDRTEIVITVYDDIGPS
jgi:hypothetical protein